MTDGGGDEQGRGGHLPAVALLHQAGDDLHGLAEPHVVGQTAVEPELFQKPQPGHARFWYSRSSALSCGRSAIGVRRLRSRRRSNISASASSRSTSKVSSMAVRCSSSWMLISGVSWPCRRQKASISCIRSRSSSTHWPRKRTSGVLASTSRRHSSSLTRSSRWRARSGTAPGSRG